VKVVLVFSRFSVLQFDRPTPTIYEETWALFVQYFYRPWYPLWHSASKYRMQNPESHIANLKLLPLTQINTSCYFNYLVDFDFRLVQHHGKLVNRHFMSAENRIIRIPVISIPVQLRRLSPREWYAIISVYRTANSCTALWTVTFAKEVVLPQFVCLFVCLFLFLVGWFVCVAGWLKKLRINFAEIFDASRK